LQIQYNVDGEKTRVDSLSIGEWSSIFCLTQCGSEQKIEPDDTWEIVAIDFIYFYAGGDHSF